MYRERNRGLPKRGDPQGHGDPIVVSEWENHLQGEVGQVGGLKYDEDTRKEYGSEIFRDSKAER